MEKKIDQLDIDTSYYVSIEDLIAWLNTVQSAGAGKVLFDGNINHMKNEVDEISIKAFTQ